MKIDDGIDKDELKEITTPAKSYARYGALGLQMVAFVILGVFGGHWIDKALGLKYPVFSLLLMLFGLVGAFWFLFQETRKN